MTFRLTTCLCKQSSVEHLGNIIYPEKLFVDNRKLDDLAGMKPPCTSTHIRSFLNVCSVYRRLTTKVNQTAGPLATMFRKREPVSSGEPRDGTQSAFIGLKKRLSSPPVLVLPRHSRWYVLCTDACARTVDCVLLQPDEDKKLRPVGYWGRTICTAKRKYEKMKRECLDMFWAVLLLRPYLQQEMFLVQTNH